MVEESMAGDTLHGAPRGVTPRRGLGLRRSGVGRSPAAARFLWVGRRVLSGILVLLVVSLIVFAATTVLPGDAARSIVGPHGTAAQLEAVRHQLGLDQSVLQRYWDWLSGVLTGDLGTSLIGKQAIGSLIGERLVNSMALLLCTALVAIPASIAVGAWLGVHRDGWLDRILTGSTLGILALPDFIIATFAVIVFATSVVELLPATSTIPPGDSPFAHLDYLVLPVLTLSLIAGAYLVRTMRAATIEILESDYVAMARLRGISRRRIIWRHAVPNALVPAIQGSALMLQYLLGGVVLVEVIFNYPGLGTLLASGVGNRDVPIVQAVAMVFAAGVVVFNLLADLLTVYATPKLRTGAGR
jgi:peptide/nickel transport system permease protein